MDIEVSETVDQEQEPPKTAPTQEPSKILEENELDLDHSDTDLQIDLQKLSPVKSGSPLTTLQQEQDIINCIEDEIGKQLDEKAEKNNLTVTNVKSIIRQVLTHEHVRALFGKDDSLQPIPYEPKLTRAKAKELLSSNAIPVPTVIPWVPQPRPSETQILIGEDLKEEDSGDEYYPGRESEEDKEESNASESDIGSLPPPTPPSFSTEDHATQTVSSYTEDGMFKIPLPKTAQEREAEEQANVALRTRSKINLSSTPLEVIEKNFVFPDITIEDLCDTDKFSENLDCDDEDWAEFLKEFAGPLEEISKPKEDDEEQDPEYNILADDEFNHVNKEDYREDFREDKAVKITKKEVRGLWHELCDYLQNISEENGDGKKAKTNDPINEVVQDSLAQFTDLDETDQCVQEPKKPMFDVIISYQQLCAIEQQMRQHVQMLTQNFFLTYEHPEFHNYSLKLKEYLLNLKFLSNGKSFSLFRPVNLLPALELVDYWTLLFATNSEVVLKSKDFVQQQILKSIEMKVAGNYNYIVKFPDLLLETILNSKVFLFPSMLPKIPFKSSQFSVTRRGFSQAEDRLLVFGLDIFKKYLTESNLKIKLKTLVDYVQEYMMPHRNRSIILKHIHQSKHPRCATNPIKQYFVRGFVEPVVHYIYPLNQISEPCKRPDELPTLWKEFLDKNISNMTQTREIVLITYPYILNNPVPAKKPKKIRPTSSKTNTFYSCNTSSNSICNNTHGTLNTSSTSIEKLISIFSRPVKIQKLVRFLAKLDDIQQVSPKRIVVVRHLKCHSNTNSMPSLDTPIKNMDLNKQNEAKEDSTVTSTTPELAASAEDTKKPETITSSTLTQKERGPKNLEFSTITSSTFQTSEVNTEVEFCRNSKDVQICQTSHSVENDAEPTTSGKDNPKDMNALMVASSALKPNVRKEPSGAEKKKNKLRKDFLANLSIATPDDPETEKHKNEMFAVAYYDKLRETLQLDDYHTIMQILNDFGSGDVIDLYDNVQAVLRPKYAELAEEFLYFLREKQASVVGQLIPWMNLQARVKFLRKLEVYMKDQPAQLKKIYNSLMELTKCDNLSMDKVKSTLVPMFKGNAILYDLFIQNFMDERPPPSLLEGPYETIDINKEMARPDNEELYESFVVPNTEDKYGGSNCICHCHKIEDNEYKSRYKHCNACGLKFANGTLYLSTGRIFQPATVTFKTNPHVNHNLRLMGKSATTAASAGHRKKRSETSPSKLAAGSSGKENLEEDTEDEELGKRKRPVSQKAPRKRKKIDTLKNQEILKSSKKSPCRSSEGSDIQKDNIKPRKRTYSGKRAKKDTTKIEKTSIEAEKSKEVEATPEKVLEVESEIIPDVEEIDVTLTTVNNVESEHATEEELDITADAESEHVTEEEIDTIAVEEGGNITEEDCYGTADEEGEHVTEEEFDTTADVEEFDTTADIEESEHETSEEQQDQEKTDDCMDSSGESLEKPLTPGQQTAESESEVYLEESSQDNYESDDTSSSTESLKGSQSDSNTNDEEPWKREEDTIILETLQKEDDKEYALQIISDKLPYRTVGQIRSRLFRLMDLLIETLKST